jgi:hypothetical protein
MWPFRKKQDKAGLAGGEPGFWLDVQDPAGLVSELAQALVGGHLMIEGSLKSLNVSALPAGTTPPPGLRRHTIWSWPKQDVLVIPVTPELLPEIRPRVIQPLNDLLPEVEHVQIARHGRLEFGVYDIPDGLECAWVSERVGEELLRNLKDRGVLRGYSRDLPPE